MMTQIVIFDCEYLTKAGAMGRMWADHNDPDPIVVQIGAVRLDLENKASIVDQIKIYIKPEDRHGTPYRLDPYFVDLTGITTEVIERDAVDLGSALRQFDAFSGGTRLWSWGKDELFALGVSCFIHGIATPIAPARFGNLKLILSEAGMPDADIKSTSSGEIADYYGVGSPSLSKHDALDDTLSLAKTLQHLMSLGHLSKDHFET